MRMISIPQAEAVRSIPGQLPRTADGDAPLRANEILSHDAQRSIIFLRPAYSGASVYACRKCSSKSRLS